MKRIFVPSDFSECAGNALDVAISLAKQYNSELHIAHGYSPAAQLISSDFISPYHGIPGSLSSEQISNLIKEQKEETAEKLAQLKARATAAGVWVETHEVLSNVFLDLLEKAEELKADLIVLGSHGASGIHEVLIGSNAQKLVRQSSIPVLTVKHEVEDYTMQHIAFASTFSQEGEKEIYKHFKKLFDRHIPKIHLLFVNTPSDFVDSASIEKRINMFIDGAWPATYEIHIFNDYSIEEGIFNFCDKNNIDTIVAATHGRTGVSRWFNSSLTENLINHGKLPVLSFKLNQ